MKIPHLVLAFLLVFAGVGCNCDTRILDAQASPDGRFVAFVYARECGATVSENRHLALLRQGQVPGDEIANVMSLDDGRNPGVKLDVRIGWRSDEELEVGVDERARAFRRATQVGPVKVTYRP